ncbi:unnamed protein product [Oppiella nova]|uniref:Uncharacterized protein n=1 Tax=Oppiella nova TaxID=334625 RepID=A0A7R9QUM1_9ACAR|nr:unnamed protein product [Oppiella nova]CAG2175580.1 unnamed protein product [Oppiella nova]
MSAFIGTFKEISSSNMVALYREYGMSEDEASRMASLTRALEFSKEGAVYAIKMIEKDSNGSMDQGDLNFVRISVLVLEDNRLVQTMGDKKGTRVVYELVGHELWVTYTAGPVVAGHIFARQ